MTRRPAIFSLLATVFIAACGGSPSESGVTSPPAGQTVVVLTAPTLIDIAPGATAKFSAQVTGTADTSVAWSVTESNGGSVDATGLYTAPVNEGTFHVRAVSTVASASLGTSVVSVKKGAPAQPIEVSVQPPTITVAVGGTTSFAAAVSGSTVGTVTWTMQEASGCGSISSAGLYTAPGAAATCHVVATSTADATKSGSATVTVVAHAPHVVSVTPPSASLLPGGTVTLSASVTGTTAGESTAVTWSVPPGAGSIGASSGVYVAPATPGTYVVTATSVATPSGTATATVTVAAHAAHVVTVTPPSASITTGGTVTFAASVTGTTAGESTSVTWSVPAGAGSINASSGVYVAPATPGTYVVTAASVATPSGTATASVTVSAPAPVVAISLSPMTATLDACKGVVFTATVTNSSNTAVNWSVVEASGGTVLNGIYTAPQTAGTYHVVAASAADPTKTVQGTITVGAEKVLSIAVTPASASVVASGSQTLAANVTTTCGTFAAQ